MASRTTWKAACALECMSLSPLPLCIACLLTRSRYLILALAFYVYPDDAGDGTGVGILSNLVK